MSESEKAWDAVSSGIRYFVGASGSELRAGHPDAQPMAFADAMACAIESVRADGADEVLYDGDEPFLVVFSDGTMRAVGKNYLVEKDEDGFVIRKMN
jgi:hypothetical protein